MNQELLDKYEEKGLDLPFSASKSGVITVSHKGEALKSQISQLATVVFETISVVGGIKIETVEIMGEAKGLIMEIEDEILIGTLFEKSDGLVIEKVHKLLKELWTEEAVAAAPLERPKARLSATTLEELKSILKEYLGDFADRVFQNQLKAQRIKPDELYEEDGRRLVFALGKAAGMIIGPTKGRELTNRLLERLK